MTEQDLDNEYAAIKAGVEGAIGEVPSPSGEEGTGMIETTAIPEEQPAPPETSTISSSGSAPSYDYSQAAEYSGEAGIDSTRLQQIVEAIVSEKFDDLTGSLGDLTAWKEKVNHDLVSMKQEILRTEERFENLQNAILGKVKDYDAGIRDVYTEMKALEKVFDKIIDPLVTNVKELSRITEDLKKSKK